MRSLNGSCSSWTPVGDRGQRAVSIEGIFESGYKSIAFHSHSYASVQGKFIDHFFSRKQNESTVDDDGWFSRLTVSSSQIDF